MSTLPVYISPADGTVAPVPSPSNGQVLIGDGAGYVPHTLTAGEGVEVANGAGSITVSLPDVGTPATYGAADSVAVLTTDTKGRVSGAATTPIAINANQVTSGTLVVARGGTGLSASGTSGNLLVSNGSVLGSVPVSKDASLLSTGALTVTGIQGQPVSTATPTTNNVLQYNGTTWVPQTITTVLQSSYQTVYGQEVGGIVAGQVVYAVSSGGGNFSVRLAQANSLTTSDSTIGLAFTPIANNTFGTAITLGQITGLNTSGLTQGAAVYVSPTTPGGLTSVRPSWPNVAFQVGYCVKQGPAPDGIIYVSPMQTVSTESITNFGNLPNTQTAPALSAGNTISAANIAGIIYYPIRVQGGSNITLGTPALPTLNNNASDWGRQLWIHNVDSARTITVPRSATVWTDGGVNLTLPPYTMARFIWTSLSSGTWVQSDKAITAQ